MESEALPETSTRPVYVEITEDDKPKRDPEISEKEGVAYWTKVCGEKGDFEDKSESPSKKKKVEKPTTRGGKIFKGTKDLPSKAQVDAQQVSISLKIRILYGIFDRELEKRS